MKLNALKSIAALAAFHLSLLGACNANASSAIPMDLNQMVASSQQIVHVRCTGNEYQADPTVGVVTVSTFVVLARAKGVAASTLVVRQAGGNLNGLAVDYHVPQFQLGEEYVLFMPAASKLGLASPVGLAQGAFSVKQGTAGKEVGNGRDIAELLSGTNAAIVPPNMSIRMKAAPSARTHMDLGEFLTLTRAKAVTQ